MPHTVTCPPATSSAGGLLLNDLYRFSPAANTWMALSPSGAAPSPRRGMGFAAAHDGMLYVFGGNQQG
jgi:N-acetylneuraminic acid mutarotase